MKTNRILALMVALSFVFLISLKISSALVINDISVDTLTPGNTGVLTIDMDNDGDNRIYDVSMSLDLSKTPLTTVGSSESSIDRIDDGDSDKFAFTLKASADTKAGDYSVPYVITYHENSSSSPPSTKTGTIGIHITASPDIVFTATATNNIVGQQGKISLQIVNKGLADARFVSVSADTASYTLLSDSQVYIGTVKSDDFETATFDVIYTKQNPVLSATVEYRDFENRKITKNVDIPLTVYSREKALQLGIIKQSYTAFYVLILVVIIVIWLVWRSISKRRRLKRSQQMNGSK